MMLVSLGLGCRNSTSTPDSSSLNLQDGPHVRVVEPEDLVPKDGSPLVFPPGTFDWQPEGLTIVVHTAYNAYFGYSYPNLIAQEAFETCGVEVGFYSRHQTQEELGLLRRQVTWFALNIEKFNYDNALHFFELYADPNPNPHGTSTGPFYWKIGDDIWVQAHRYYGIKMCLPSVVPGLRAIYEEGEPPRVSQEWLDYIEEVQTGEIKGEVFVWHPYENQLFKRDVGVDAGQGSQWPYQHRIGIHIEGDW